jgi:hypothetical protein
MSKVNKVLLVIGTVCLVLGLIIGTTAFALARFDLRALSTTEPYTSIKYTAGSTDIDTIEFSGVSDSVTVQRGSVKTIEIEYWYNNDFYYTIDEKSHTLKMQFDSKPFHNWIGMNFTGFDERDVVITVPESFAGTLDINTVSGDLSIDAGRSLEILDVDTVSGRVKLEGGDLDTVTIDGVSGNVNLVCGAVGSMRIDTVSGNVDVSSDSIKKLTFNSISGNIDVWVADKVSNYSIDTDTLSGEIDVPRTLDNAKNTMNFDTTSGSIRVELER